MTNALALREASGLETYQQASLLFEGSSAILATMRELGAKLSNRNIDYAVIGYPRYSEQLAILVTEEGHQRFKKELLGRGGFGNYGWDSVSDYVRTVRAYPAQVVVNFRLAGEYPGDGKAKPISFPNPAEVSIEIDGINFLTLENVVELQLASGMTAPDRLKDLADIQELIKILKPSREFAEKLHPYVREKFLELLDAVERGARIEFEEQS
jgi:hypothetical protein